MPLQRVGGLQRRLSHLAGAARTAGGRSALVRAHRFDAIGREAPAVAVQVGDLWYFVPTNDVVGKLTFLEGGFEQKVMEAAVSLLEERLGRPPVAGRTFVDVGANIGTSTIPALAVLGARHAVAIEPARANCRLLRANIAANDLGERVTVVQVALSAEAGEVELELGPDNSGDYRIRLSSEPGSIGETGWATETVAAASFDEVCRQHSLSLDDVGLVWMDTQGHEAHVLEGAQSLLASTVPVVAEYWPYGLRRAGTLDRLHAIVGDHYRQVIDVRASMATGRIEELPASEVAALAGRYDAANHWEYTDIALLK